MAGFIDRLAGALGFTNEDAERDNYDDYDDYKDYEEDYRDSYGSSRYDRGGYSRNNSSNYRTNGSTYDRSSYNTGRDSFGSSYGASSGSSFGTSSAGTPFGNSTSGRTAGAGSPFTSSYSGTSTQQNQSGPNFRTMGYSTSSSTSANGGKILNLNANVQMEVVVASPESFDEARQIAQSIKNNKPVIINLEFVEHATAQRLTDFLCGCCCAVDGNIQRIADKIFMIAPGNVDFAGDVDIRQSLQTEGLAFPFGAQE